MTRPVTLSAGLHLQANRGPRTYRARLIRAGRVVRADGSPGPFEIPVQALEDAACRGLFDNLAMFVDHAGGSEGPSLRNLAAVVEGVWHETDAISGEFRVYDTQAGRIVAGLIDQLLADQEAGRPAPDIGLSLVFYPEWKPRAGEEPLTLARFRKIESADFVFQPAADGRILEALTALSALNVLGSRDPATPHLTRSQTMPKETGSHDTTAHLDAARDDGAAGSPRPQSPTEDGRAWLSAVRQATVEAQLAASGLPAVAVARLRGQTYRTPAELEAAIAVQQALIADALADRVVDVGADPPRPSGISLGRTSLEQIQTALEALIEGVHPPDGIRPLSGIREFYHLLSGDYEMTGRYHADRVMLANVTSSTMAGLVANALNKRVVNLFQQYPKWWAPIVTIEDFTSLQQVKWITLGGVGELPTVAEGAAYTEMTWDDQTETATFVKKGGYLGITLEAMDKDDTNRLRAAPRALAQAAWLTLSKAISAIFTDNSGTGPAMSDSSNLFDAGNHGNLLTTALSYAQWTTVRIAMMKQTEVNSAERLGFLTAPKYCLVPIDLEATALEIFASEGEPGTPNNDANLYSVGDNHRSRLQSARSRVVVCPIWTDTNNWAAVADPDLYPSIGLGFRYGRNPEIFSVASPNAGLMFTNDTLPVKVRFFFAVGPTDWRGLHKSNVA